MYLFQQSWLEQKISHKRMNMDKINPYYCSQSIVFSLQLILQRSYISRDFDDQNYIKFWINNRILSIMSYQQDKKIEISQEPAIQTVALPHNSVVDIKNIERYQQSFPVDLIRLIELRLKQFDLQSRFERYGLKYNTQFSFQSHLSLNLIMQSINSEIIKFEVKWGKFQMNILILNIVGKSSIHTDPHAQGAYGSIYRVNLMENEFIMKCIPNEQNTNQNKVMAIKEYFLLKIVSALEIGPSMKSWLGFDLIMYQNCVEFAMEKCQQVTAINQSSKLTLIENIYVLHKFGIVHMDIKPQNIMFSKCFNKVIYIDYGLSQLIDVKIGQTMLVSFRGTLDYCCPQMISAFTLNKKQYVDLYHNDIFALQTSIRFFQQNEMSESSQIQQYIEREQCKQLWADYKIKYQKYKNNQILSLTVLKFILFCGNIYLVETNKHFTTLMNQVFSNEILDFLYELENTQNIKYFYRKVLNTHNKESIKYTDLKDIYQSHFTEFKLIKRNEQKRNTFRNYYCSLTEYISMEQFEIFTEQKIKNILESQRKQNIQLFSYFRIYLKYINFSNNTFNVNMNQRLQITKLIVQKKYVKSINIQKKNDLEIIMEVIVYMLAQVMDEFKEKEKANRCVKELIFDLIEHVFILSIDSNEKILQYIQQIYNCKWLEDADKIEFVLKVKHYGYWFRYRIRGGTTFYKIYNWFNKKIHLLLNKNQIDLIYESTFRESTINQIENRFGKLSKYLETQIKMEMLYRWLCQFHSDQTAAFLARIYKLINHTQRLKIYFFTLQIYHQYLIKFYSLKKCEQYDRFFERNIQSQSIMNSMIFKYLPDLFERYNDNKFMKSLSFILQNIDISTLKIFNISIKEGIQFLFTLTNKENYKIKANMLNKLRYLSQLINITQMLELEAQAQHLPQFFQTNEIKNLIYIKILCCLQCQCHHQIKNDIEILKRKIDQIKCRNCHFRISNLYLLTSQKYYYFSYIKQKTKDNAEHFLFYNNQLSKLYSTMQNIEQNKFLNYCCLYQFSKSNQEYEKQYQGKKQLYLFLKQYPQYFSKFFSDFSIKYVLPKFLKMVLFDISLQQLSSFLINLSSRLIFHFSSSYFYNLNSSFQQLCYKYQKSIDFTRLFNYIDQQKFNKQTLIYNQGYYQQMLYYLPQNLIYKSKITITKLLQLLPKEIRRWQQFFYYRFLVIEYSTISNPVIIDEGQSIKARKKAYLKKQLIKISSIVGKQPLKRKSKKLKNSNIKLNYLYKKILLLGGPFNFGVPELSNVYLRARNKLATSKKKISMVEVC